MNVLTQHIFIKMKQLIRQPSYVVSTLIFPSVFFLFFALPNIEDTEGGNLLIASFSAYAFLGVVFLQLGVDVSQERANAWSQYIKTLPLKNTVLFFAKSFVMVIFSIVSTLLLIAVAKLTAENTIGPMKIAQMMFYLIVFSMPFCMMGLSIGYWFSSKSSLPVTNLFYILLSFLGGLWIPPNALPTNIQKLSEFLPSRHYGEIVWAVVNDQAFKASHFYGLGFYFVVFFVIAYLGYKRSRN